MQNNEFISIFARSINTGEKQQTGMQMDNLTEQALIRELKQGSQTAFNGIYKIYAKRLFAYCLQYTKRVEDAEEIVQDVFMQLWNSRERIRQEETLRSLLFIIAKHHLINAYKSMVNSPVYENYVNYQNELATDDVHHHLEYEEFVEQLRKAIRRLPVTQQKVIVLARLEGLPHKEIAEKLSLSVQTVKNQLSIGLKALREELNKSHILLEVLLFVNYLCLMV
jgi:RNA polymerase sigma-70 factor (ECF subfamily)